MTSVARVYGIALYEIAKEEGQEREFQEALEQLQYVLQQKAYRSRLLSAHLERAEKQRITKNLLKTLGLEKLNGFVSCMIAHAREAYLEETVQFTLERLQKKEQNKVVMIQSATPLSQNEKRQIEEKLQEKMKGQKITYRYQVDKTLIGGLIIQLGALRLDGSIQTRLKNLEKNLQRKVLEQ